ncbi:DUF7524 family protein [Halobacterium noricense]|uniref:DUF7524 family protein n=1 Tax=Halobacterium noricense TaxID=223182 RepID=UPI001E5AE78B|nr:hypothetical protein [Halobacterium noricense]UHH26706.1 hypothetical protein LT974_07190 [Halobacterium noricense]
MPERLSVHLNRDHPRDLQPEAASLETDRSFVLVFENHGGPVHVHLHLDDALAAVADIAATQVYVDEGETRGVEISIPSDHPPTKGYVELSTGYGAEQARVNVTVTDKRKDGGPDVAVDESLSEKSEPVGDEESVALADVALPTAAAAAVVVVAAALTLSISDSVAMLIGVLALLGGVGVAAYVLAT